MISSFLLISVCTIGGLAIFVTPFLDERFFEVTRLGRWLTRLTVEFPTSLETSPDNASSSVRIATNERIQMLEAASAQLREEIDQLKQELSVKTRRAKVDEFNR